jgi:para-nitrobenzyl esterase
MRIRILLLGALMACQSHPMIVSTDAGLVSGTTDAVGDVRIFKSIPFAAPPIGPLRWTEPQHVTPWIGVRRCVSFGANPIQENGGVCSEDCLYLNVWTTKGNSSAKKPVIAWIYGGGFTVGSGAGGWYDGEAIRSLRLSGLSGISPLLAVIRQTSRSLASPPAPAV